MKRIAVLAALVTLVAWNASVQAEKKTGRQYTNLRDPATSGLPFSDGVLVGDTLYLAGRIGLEPDTPASRPPTPRPKRASPSMASSAPSPKPA